MTNSNPFYVCEDYFLLIYETKENAAAGRAMPGWVDPAAVAVATAAVAGRLVLRGGVPLYGEAAAEYWSKRLNSRVLFSNPNEPIFLIKKEDKYWHVIIGERVGWIIAEDWIGIKELKNNAK